MRRLDARLPLTAMIAAGALACASAQKPSATPSPSAPPSAAPSAPAPAPAAAMPSTPAVDSGLLFAVEPSDAEILIDGRPSGTVAALAGAGGLLRLVPGIYQVSLKAPGFVTWRAEVALRAGTETIRVKLARKP